MSDLPLGKIIEGTQQRDAIHIAVASVVAGERLVPGAHIGFIGTDTEVVGVRAVKLIGIVDPFLTAIVEREQRFWMFLYPQTITSLRHDWTHPAFEQQSAAPAAPNKSESERWLSAYAEKFPGWSLERMLESAEDKVRGGYGQNSHTDIPNGAFDELSEFWKHYEIVSGVKVDDETRDELPFHCAC